MPVLFMKIKNMMRYSGYGPCSGPALLSGCGDNVRFWAVGALDGLDAGRTARGAGRRPFCMAVRPFALIVPRCKPPAGSRRPIPTQAALRALSSERSAQAGRGAGA